MKSVQWFLTRKFLKFFLYTYIGKIRQEDFVSFLIIGKICPGPWRPCSNKLYSNWSSGSDKKSFKIYYIDIYREN